MVNPWLHKYAILLGILTLLLVATGGAVSTNPYRPLYSFGEEHTLVGAGVGVLTLGLVVWLSIGDKRIWLRRLGWTAFGAVAVEALIGVVAEPQSPVPRVIHSLMAQLIFSFTVAIAVFTSSAWQRPPEPVEDRSSLRFLAKLAPAVVLVQVALGVAFRQGVTGVMPHILGAFIVTFLILAVALFVIYRPEHAALRPAGITLLIILSVQVFLGLGLFSIMGIDDMDPLVVIIVVLTHAVVGALTLATSVVMALLVWRGLRAPASR